MSTPNLRVVRQARALTAAVTAAVSPVTDTSRIFSATTGHSARWQDDAWRYRKTVGELGYFVRWRSNACAQVRLVASAIDPDTGLPTGSIDPDDLAGREVVNLTRQVAGGPLGQKHLIKRAVACLTVAGELHICILQRPEGERWFAVSDKQIRKSSKYVDLPGGGRGPTVTITLPDGTLHDFTPVEDAMFRVWLEDDDDPTLATSPVQGVLDVCAEIERATKKIRNADRSRLLNNGLLMVPSEASLPETQTAAGDTGTRRVAASLQKMLVQAAEVADRDDNSMASVLPIVGAAPGEHLGKIVHVEFAKEATTTAIDIRNDAIARLARGIDMTPERLLGMGANSNHWSARFLDDDDVKSHIAPVMEVLCNAIYQAVFVPILTTTGVDTDAYTLWYDTSRLTADPDITDEAKDAHTAGAIRSKAFVAHLGLPESDLYDWSTADGLAEWARDRISTNPALIHTLGALVPELAPHLDKLAPPPPPQLDNNTDNTDKTPPEADEDEPDTENNEPPEPGQQAASARLSTVIDRTRRHPQRPDVHRGR